MNLYRTSLLALSLLISACASSPSVSNDSPLYMDRDGYSTGIVRPGSTFNPDIVRVVAQAQYQNLLLVKREADSSPNQHPQNLTKEQVEALLKPILVMSPGNDKEPLFNDDELGKLSSYFLQALQLAGPNEDIVFHMIQERARVFATAKLMTTGRIFFVDGKLNIIFGTIQQNFEADMIYGGAILPRFKVGTRASSSLSGWQIVSNKQAVLAQPQRKDWVQISLAPAQVAPLATTPQPVQLPAPTRSAEERLQKLQQLKDKGLINEQEYQDKRKQILESL